MTAVAICHGGCNYTVTSATTIGGHHCPPLTATETDARIKAMVADHPCTQADL